MGDPYLSEISGTPKYECSDDTYNFWNGGLGSQAGELLLDFDDLENVYKLS